MIGKAVRRVGTGLSLCGGLSRYLQLEAARWGSGQQPRSVRLRYKPTGDVWMRNGTTDYPTLVSCFVKGFHRPLRPLPPRPTILDIGANVGYTLIDFRHHHPDARLIGVEMDADNHALATRNIDGLGRVLLLHAAIWCEDGEVRYDAGANADAFAVGSGGAAQRSVESLTMGTLLDRCAVERADYVKLDIEGAEKDLFGRGDLAWLQRVDQISVELHGTLDSQSLVALLRAHGFDAAKDSRHWDTVVAWRGGSGTAGP